MKRLLIPAILILMFAVYAGVVVVGAWLSKPQLISTRAGSPGWKAWRVDSLEDLPAGDTGDRVRYGRLLFNETATYASAFTGDRLSCASCHLQGGTAPYASPMVGVAKAFPMYSKRAGRPISLTDRIEECMTRSENGKPLPIEGREMRALVAYIDWLSEPHRDEAHFIGRGFIALPQLQPNPAHGAQVYAAQCAGCHGANGQGKRPMSPPLWGPDSFNDGAGMDRVEKMAPFVQYNMPANRKGILSAQDAIDVSTYIHQQPRPAFDQQYEKF